MPQEVVHTRGSLGSPGPMAGCLRRRTVPSARIRARPDRYMKDSYAHSVRCAFSKDGTGREGLPARESHRLPASSLPSLLTPFHNFPPSSPLFPCRGFNGTVQK